MGHTFPKNAKQIKTYYKKYSLKCFLHINTYSVTCKNSPLEYNEVNTELVGCQSAICKLAVHKVNHTYTYHAHTIATANCTSIKCKPQLVVVILPCAL